MTLLQLCFVPLFSVLHEDLSISGCSDYDGEFVYTLDGEELVYADFKKEIIVDAQPPFVGHISYPAGAYDSAKVQQQQCRQNLRFLRKKVHVQEPEVSEKIRQFEGFQSSGLSQTSCFSSVPPSNVVVYNRDEVDLGEQNTLICHVSGFYPAPVNVSWTRNGEKVSGRINVPLPNSDGTFTQISRLPFVPQLGDIYSCSVEHPALPEVQTKIWDVEKSQPGVGPAVLCGLSVVVGLLGMATGTYFFIKGKKFNCS
uniref:Ig-like domain-containing protein n=1 Tax=Oryzias sinensis TaxID=183150 RepID=A0A8C7ZTJ5_9TELE